MTAAAVRAPALTKPVPRERRRPNSHPRRELPTVKEMTACRVRKGRTKEEERRRAVAPVPFPWRAVTHVMGTGAKKAESCPAAKLLTPRRKSRAARAADARASTK